VKHRKIFSFILLLAFLAKMTASFGYFQNSAEANSIDLKSLNKDHRQISFKVKDVLHHQDNQIFNLEELNFENEEEDNGESFHKHFTVLYSIIFEVPNYSGISFIFYNNTLFKRITAPIFITLGQLVI
jgi:hypothetical protein